MRKKILWLLSLVPFAGILLLSNTIFQNEVGTREKVLSQLIYDGVKNWHYSREKINDDYSEKAFSEFLEYLDFGKRFFLSEDVSEFQKYRNRMDDMFSDGNMEMMVAVSKRLEQRINQVLDFYPQFLAEPFDFTKQEYIDYGYDKRSYSSDLNELKAYWRKILKEQTLMEYQTMCIGTITV